MNCRSALLTAPTVGGIATVRLDGPDCLDLLSDIFSPASKTASNTLSTEDFENGKSLLFGNLHENGEILDQVVVAHDPANKTVDINCHGGTRIIQRLMILLKNKGTQIIDAKKIIENSSIAAELQACIPKAPTPKTVLAIANQYPGGLYQWCQKSLENLMKCHNNDDENSQKNAKIVENIQKEAVEIRKTAVLARKLLDPPTIVLVGPVNAGKSTIANILSKKQLSIAADLEGTTRDWTSQVVDIQGFAFRLIDTAGRRKSDDMLEQQSLLLANEQINKAKLIFLIVPADRLGLLEEQLADLPENIAVQVVINKADLVEENVIKDCETKGYVCISAADNSGFDRLYNKTIEIMGLGKFEAMGALAFTDRQCVLLDEISQSLDLQELTNLINAICG